MTLLAAIALVLVMLPGEWIPPILPMHEYWANDPRYAGGAYAFCFDNTIRLSENVDSMNVVWVASLIVHETEHLREGCIGGEHGALTKQAAFVDMLPVTPYTNDLREHLWRLQREAARRERVDLVDGSDASD